MKLWNFKKQYGPKQKDYDFLIFGPIRDSPGSILTELQTGHHREVVGGVTAILGIAQNATFQDFEPLGGHKDIIDPSLDRPVEMEPIEGPLGAEGIFPGSDMGIHHFPQDDLDPPTVTFQVEIPAQHSGKPP